MAEETKGNAEWRLSDFLDALTAEMDRAQDTLSLKSFARGMSVAVKGLTLDLAVQVRVDEKGQVFFRSAEPGQPSPTILKLDLQETFQSQLEEVRKPLDDTDLGLPLSSLTEITTPEIEALHTLSIFTVDDLRRFCRTPALLSEVSRRTGIAEIRLRGWLGLPFLTNIAPAAGAPGQTAVIEGGSLGAQGGDDAVLFQTIEARLFHWENSRITVEIPAGASSGPVYARIDGARSNVLLWQVQPSRIDLQVLDLTLVPESPTEAQEILFGASYSNRGDLASGTFSVEWSIDDARALLSEDTGLAPGQSRHVELRLKLAPGSHRVRLSIDPEGRLPLADRGKAIREQNFNVLAVPPPPRIQLTEVVPKSGTAASTLAVILQGSDFQDGATISFGDSISIAQIKVESSNRITAQISIDEHAALGPRDVKATLPDGISSDTLRAGFTVVPPLPRIQLTEVEPKSGVLASTLAVELQGIGFQNGSTVSFGDAISVSQINVTSSNRITAQLSIDEHAAPGPRDVTATLPGGIASDTLRAGFTTLPALPPGDLAVISLAPNSSRAGIIVTVTIIGRGFQPNISASFTPPFDFQMDRISSEKLTGNLTIPPQSRGPLTLTLTNPDGSRLVVPNAFQALGPAGKAKV